LGQLSSTHLFNNMDEFVLMRFSSTTHGLQIDVCPVAVDKNHPCNRQLFFQVSDQPVPMYSQEVEVSRSTVKEENSDDQTICLSSDSEVDEPLENQKKRRMPPRRCKRDVRKKYRMEKKDEIDKPIQKSGRIAGPSKKAKIPYHKRYFAF
jgi:hypothetical protein